MDIEALETKYANELDYLQYVFDEAGITTVNQTLLVTEIENAYTAIRTYLRLKADADCSAYFLAACELANAYYNNRLVNLKKISGDVIISQQSLGGHSVSFGSKEITLDSRGLTDKVKALLPCPPIIAM